MSSLDRFSGHANQYARYRIDYPDELYRYVLARTPNRGRAWDCATGNGQAARALAQYFDHVDATDLSPQQLAEAPPLPNVTYQPSPAEHTPFANATFDLVTVGQALHWFNVDAFHDEVRRVAKPGATLAEWGYGLCHVTPDIDALVHDFYENVIGTYWDAMRRHIENEYATLPFDFMNPARATFAVARHWTAEWFLGYLRTWSAVKNYEKANGHDPVTALEEPLRSAWGTNERLVTFPVFLRIGNVA